MPPQDSSFDERYRAVESRDGRFDGQFVTAVRTTGIYCRPSCPARTPHRENVRFYRTSAAAHAAGYRACKRCVPEAVPGSPEWDLRGDVVGRAMRLITEGVVDREGVLGLARRVGYSTRHLTRVLTEELGAGPLALARAHRAQTARALLTQTDLPVAETAFAAGFSSIRQCNEVIREVYDMTPQQLRARSMSTGPSGHGAASEPGEVDLALSYREPLDVRGLFVWFAVHAVDGVEVGTPTSYTRALSLPGGPAWLRVYERAGRLRLRTRVTDLADLPVLIARVRRLFDLDADPEAVAAALSRVPVLRPLVEAAPGLRVAGSADPHETLIRTLIGQQISLAAARTVLGARARDMGEPAPSFATGIRYMFPTAAAIAEHGVQFLGGPAARVQAVLGAARALASGDLQLSPGDDATQQRAALLTLPGVGPWTADHVRMRVTGDPDVFLIDDGAMRAGARRLGLPDTKPALVDWAGAAAPWRSYATTHLWGPLTPPASFSESVQS
ncbi:MULTISPECIES: DNA-3-methyladenine glycosylase 2 family protein [Kocuria]|uniref:DNA-3-methyladenine glycosylase 2 family protein n=1 Tax=Kocuria TaxID=57493 RepID=UPI0007EBD810|nr:MULTISPECIES: AlkA N-terminal domain-containing protein [Kocuria]MBX7555698.1 helix-turn-helix domain-containing protein [Streptomyces sp. tea 10]MBN6812727.1 DNA-3-methyladenine glycosylase 2 family protein [Kocuria indica]MBN6844420.1 DNA-3-methyladenine glycosylase 2 family protein [Kocuria indica]MCT2362162.1 helix-turn-helix domain-containing protein [Kocuria marina]OBA50356.1 DNA-3-methyladenine glycosylase [Kocuria sp. ICS0012]